MAEAPKLDPWKSATSNIDEETANMLAAVATAGTAGLAAYDEAKAGNTATQQAAVAAALKGVGGNTFDSPGTGLPNDMGALQNQALATARAGFSSGLENMKARNQSYMGKLSATLPILQEQNQLKYAARDAQLNAVVQERNRQEAERLAAEERERQWQLDLAQTQRTWDVEDRDFAAKHDLTLDDRAAARSTASSGGSGSDMAASGGLSEVELKGLTERQLEQDKSQIPTWQTRLDELDRLRGIWTSNSNVEAMVKEVGELTQTRAQIMKTNKDPKATVHIDKQMNELGNKIKATKAYNKGALSQSQAEYDQLTTSIGEATQRMLNPTAFARQTAIDQGGDPNTVYGTLTTKDFEFLAQSPTIHQAIAKATKVVGGAGVVAAILNHPTNKDWMNQVANDPEVVSETDIKNDLLLNFPGPNKKRTRDVLFYVMKVGK